MNNSNTTELCSFTHAALRNTVTLYKTETPEFDLFAIIHTDHANDTEHIHFFGQNDEINARKKFASITRALSTIPA